MAKVLFTARAHVTGGRDSHGRSDDGALEVDPNSSSPSDMPSASRAPWESSPAARRSRRGGDRLGGEPASQRGRGCRLAVVLNVSLPSVDDRETASEPARGAYEVCPYSNATRGNIDVDLLVDGSPV